MSHAPVVGDYSGEIYEYKRKKVSRRLLVLLVLGLAPLLYGLFSLLFIDDTEKLAGGWGMTLKVEQDFWAITIGIMIVLQFAIIRYSPNRYIHKMTLAFTMTTVLFAITIVYLYAQWLAHYPWFPGGSYYGVSPEESTFFTFDKILHFLGSMTLALILMFMIDREGQKPVRILYAGFIAMVLMVGFELLEIRHFEILMNPEEVADVHRDLLVNGVGFLAGILLWVIYRRRSYRKAVGEMV